MEQNKKNTVLAIFLSIFALAGVAGQQMNSRPVLWLGPIVDLSGKKDGDLPLGPVAFTMLQTRIQSSQVFKLGSTSPIELAQIKNVSDKGAFYLEGTIYRVSGEIQLDLRALSVPDAVVVYSDFFTINGEGFLRKALNKTVEVLGEQLFRDVLGRLELATSVGGADVYLDGIYFGKTDDDGRIRIPQLYPGTYNLRVLAEGYREYLESLSISPRRVALVNAALQEEPGSLLVQSSPDGASVVLDGVEVGSTPLEIPQIDTGEHNLALRKADYTEYSQKISVRSREQRRIQAELSILPGSVRIVTEPKGASVALAGKSVGVTPLTQYELAPGKYIFDLHFPSYRDAALPVEIKAGAQTSCEATLYPKTARVNIDTQPQGVLVSIQENGGKIPLGETPIRDKEVRLGRIELIFEKEEYYPATKVLTISNEQPIALEQDLAIKPGALRIVSSPSGANVEIDGERKGQTPLAFAALDPGLYRIKVYNSLAAETKTIEVKPDGIATAEVELTKKPFRFRPAVIMASIALGAFMCVAGQ